MTKNENNASETTTQQTTSETNFHESARAHQAEGAQALGSKKTVYTNQYDPQLLEAIPNVFPQNDFMVSMDCSEFTSLCARTRQPDFATVSISYIPDEKLVESKSLKLYLFSFREEGSFHETCMNMIMEDLNALLEPKYIEVFGNFTPRGGICILPFVNYAKEGSGYEDLAKQRKFEMASRATQLH